MREANPSVLVALNERSAAVAQLLRQHHLQVTVCRSGMDVVQSLFPRGDAYSQPPSLMVLSAILPGYNGLSVLAGVRSFGWNTPVLMSWPSRERWIPGEATRLGCSGLFEGPVDEQRVLAEALRVLYAPERGAQLESPVAGPTHGNAA